MVLEQELFVKTVNIIRNIHRDRRMTVKESDIKESWWWKRGQELAQLEKHPLHQSRLQQFDQEKEQLEQYIKQYQEGYNELKNSIDNKIEIYRYGKGGEALHRGGQVKFLVR